MSGSLIAMRFPCKLAGLSSGTISFRQFSDQCFYWLPEETDSLGFSFREAISIFYLIFCVLFCKIYPISGKKGVSDISTDIS